MIRLEVRELERNRRDGVGAARTGYRRLEIINGNDLVAVSRVDDGRARCADCGGT